MAAKKTLNLDNLQALGAKRLAEILLELSQGDAATKRRLRLELAAEAGAEVYRIRQHPTCVPAPRRQAMSSPLPQSTSQRRLR